MATSAVAPTKTRPALNDPVRCFRKPMTIGVVIVDKLPNRLKTPPLTPTSSLGEASAITVQPSAPNPLPKNASVISPITTACVLVQLQAMMLTEISMPATMGALHANVSEWPRLSSQSEQTPPTIPPIQPASAGSPAAAPACRIDI